MVQRPMSKSVHLNSTNNLPFEVKMKELMILVVFGFCFGIILTNILWRQRFLKYEDPASPFI